MAATTINGTFTELGDYGMFCPLDGSIRVNDEDVITSIDVGGAVGMEDLEDGIDFVFEGENGNTYTDDDMHYNN